MDHAVQMGVECVERLLNGRPEDCVRGRISPKGEQDLGLLAEKTIELTSRRALRRAGLGPLYERFLKVKDKLEREGLFDAAAKRELVPYPRAIGVVTSLAAAALRDVLTTLARRNPAIQVIVYPTPVQGEGAAARIAAALRRASARAECDVLLLVRGGGSIEDLWQFNEEVVARAIRDSRIPVAVGVGHESDFTIATSALRCSALARESTTIAARAGATSPPIS